MRSLSASAGCGASLTLFLPSVSPSERAQHLTVALPPVRSLVALKLLIGISLRSFASHRLLTSSHRLAEEALASRSRPKIGVSAAEAALDRDVAAVLQAGEGDGGRGGGAAAGDGARKKGLEELGRYDMVKSRLW